MKNVKSIHNAHMVVKDLGHIAFNSLDQRKQVGAFIAKVVMIDGKVFVGQTLSSGYNGLPAGSRDPSDLLRDGRSKPELIHAEVRAIVNIKSEESLTLLPKERLAMFTSSCPCERCAGMIVEAGIDVVFYNGDHDHNIGLNILNEYGVDHYGILLI